MMTVQHPYIHKPQFGKQIGPFRLYSWLKKLLFLSVFVVLTVPVTVKVAHFSLFDWIIYPIMSLFFVFDWVALSKKKGTIEKVRLGFYGLFLVTGLSFVTNFRSYGEQMSFMAYRGMSTNNLEFQLLIYAIMTLFLLMEMYSFGARFMVSEHDISSVVFVILVGGTINALITLGAWITETQGVLGRYNYTPPIEQSQGVHVGWMTLVFMLAFVLWTGKAKLSRVKMVGLSFTMLVSLLSIMTVFERAGWVKFALILVLFVTSMWAKSSRQSQIRMISVIIVVIGAGVTAILASNGLILHLFAGLADSYSSDIYTRRVLFDQGIDVFRAYPLFGVGYGFYTLFSTEPIFVTSGYRFVASPHNGMALLLAELGIIGGSIFLWMIANLLHLCSQSVRLARRPFEQSLTLLFFIYLIIELLMLFTSNGFLGIPTQRGSLYLNSVTWFFWGVCAGLTKREKILRRQ